MAEIPEIARPEILIKPDKKLLKKVLSDNKALKKASIYREEAPTYKDHKASPSAPIIEELNNE